MLTAPEKIVEAYDAGDIRNILLIRISRVGDLIFITPAIRCLKNRFPEAELHFLTNPYSAQVLEGNPNISRVHLMDRKGLSWRLLRIAPAISELRDARVDLVIPFRWRDEYKTLFRKINARLLYRLRMDNSSGKTHMADRFVAGLLPLGVEPDGRGMDVFYGTEDEKAVKDFLAAHALEGRPLIVLHAGCHQARKIGRGGSAAKRIWPVAHWADLIRMVYQKYGVSPVLTGFSAGDIAGNDMIAGIAGLDVPQFTKQSLNGLAALLARARAFVCGDTGPLHVASAVGAPTVALFGPSRPTVTGPYMNSGGAVVLQKEIECVPCKGKDVKCRDNICMQQISANGVYEALSKIMDAPVRS